MSSFLCVKCSQERESNFLVYLDEDNWLLSVSICDPGQESYIKLL